MKRLWATVAESTRTTSPSLVNEATATQKKYEALFNPFAKCHSKYNSSDSMEYTEIHALVTTTNIIAMVLQFSLRCELLFMFHGLQYFVYLFDNRDRGRVCKLLQDNIPRCFLPTQTLAFLHA